MIPPARRADLPFERVVLILGMPRSGTSWLSQIVDSSPEVRFRLAPIFSYAFKNAVHEGSSRAEWEALFRGAYHSDDPFMSQAVNRAAGRYPVFDQKAPQPQVLAIKETRFHNFITRTLDLFPDLKIAAIVRHPCGAIHSWLSTPKEFPPGADPLSEWRTGRCRKTTPEEFWGFEDWKSVTRQHLALERSRPERVRIVHYETLVEEAAGTTRALFDFLGLPFAAPTERFLRDSQERHVEDSHAVFKHKRVKDRWRTDLHPSIRDAILGEIEGTDLERFLS
ncbi:MAG TPA: sulfotransferase [Candidatus Polarisedimenticolia bacterium]|nr:sulfotransferase [Candidatus Polarisedimenticolia bacterium]